MAESVKKVIDEFKVKFIDR